MFLPFSAPGSAGCRAASAWARASRAAAAPGEGPADGAEGLGTRSIVMRYFDGASLSTDPLRGLIGVKAGLAAMVIQRRYTRFTRCYATTPCVASPLAAGADDDIQHDATP